MRDSSKAMQSAKTDFGRSVAVSALSFLGADAERLRRFLDVTGLGPHNLRGAAADPAFYGSVLEYLVADEQLLVRFAADAGLEPEAVARAHQALCGPPPSGEP
jgi:hypothetical protein